MRCHYAYIVLFFVIYRPVMEVMIFRYRQTNRHFIKIYINFSHWVGCNQVFKWTSSRNENKTHPLSKPTSSYSALLPQVHRICCSVPFYHCFGNVAGTLAGLLHGASLIVPCPRFCGFWCPVWSKNNKKKPSASMAETVWQLSRTKSAPQSMVRGRSTI